MKKNEELKKLIFKANTFFERELSVHITLKNGSWKNGKILEINDDYLFLEERLEEKMPIFFEEIKDIVKYIPKGVG